MLNLLSSEELDHFFCLEKLITGVCLQITQKKIFPPLAAKSKDFFSHPWENGEELIFHSRSKGLSQGAS
jgi:hypothetical protein